MREALVIPPARIEEKVTFRCRGTETALRRGTLFDDVGVFTACACFRRGRHGSVFGCACAARADLLATDAIFDPLPGPAHGIGSATAGTGAIVRLARSRSPLGQLAASTAEQGLLPLSREWTASIGSMSAPSIARGKFGRKDRIVRSSSL